jgi:hypothetical protein
MAGECPGWDVVKPLSVSADDAYGEVTGNIQASAGSTAVITGGSAPYTYAWTFVSGPGVFAAFNTTTAAAQWKYTTTAPDDTTEVWKITVTDSLSATANVNINVRIVHL